MKLIFKVIAMMALGLVAMQSCESGKSYAELLNDENKAVNRFLADQRVERKIPADTVFEIGPDAPYYCLDDEGNIYMQVLNPGSGEKAKDDQVVYFRFMRYNLHYYEGPDKEMIGEGNQDNMTESPTSFRYQNYNLPSSSAWGSGVQLPLEFLPLDCEINLVVKSQYGWSSEISYVQPYLYHIRYYKSQI